MTVLPRGEYFQIRRSGEGGLDLTSSLEAKFGARSGQVHKIRGKIWEVLSPKDAKVGKSPNFGVISEIQRAKFGIFVIYIFGGKIWGSNKNFRGKICGQAPPDLLIWKYPPGCAGKKLYTLRHVNMQLDKLHVSRRNCRIYFQP